MQFGSLFALLYSILFVDVNIGWWISAACICFILSVFGSSVGYHHTICHKTFTFSRPIEIILMWLGTLATLHPPRSWAITHYIHHMYTDTEDDPHSPTHKRWKVWFFYNHRVTKYNMRDLLLFKNLFKDKVVIWMESEIGYWTVILSFPLLAFLVGGMTGLLFLWLIPNAFMIASSLAFVMAHDNNSGVKSNILSLLSFGDGEHDKHHEQWNFVCKFHIFCANLIGNKNGIYIH